jgi:hypothetical protein
MPAEPLFPEPPNTMKNLLILAVLVVGAYMFYQRSSAQDGAVSTAGYSLRETESKPIPKPVFFALWDEVALGTCADAQQRYNLSPQACEAKVRENAPACAQRAGAGAPASIGDAGLSRTLGRQYMECVVPHFTCNGVEVRTQEEAQRHCR